MRQTAMRLLAALLLALLPLPALAFELWNGASTGMSAASVQSLHPGAAPNPTPDSLAGGAEDLLVDPNVRYADGTYRARYFFRDGKLAQVTLTLDVSASEHKNIKRHFRAALKTMTARFGAPTTATQQLLLATDTLVARWDHRPRRMSIIAYQDVSKLLNINFQNAALWD